MPELPDAKAARYAALGVRPESAALLAYDVDFSRFFDKALEFQKNAQALANWLTGDVTGYLNTHGLTLETSQLTPEHLAGLVSLVEAETISGKIAKDLLPEVIGGADPAVLVRERGLEQVTDTGALAGVVAQVLTENPKMVDEAKNNPKAINALLGRVMKASGGKANPAKVRELISEKLANELP